MAQTSRFFQTSGVGDGPAGGYSAAAFQEFLRKSLQTDPATESVLRGLGGDLAVTSGSGQVSVASGNALVYGCWYQNDASLGVAIPTPTSATRKDRIVLRVNLTSSPHADGQVGQTVRVARLAGVEGSPTAPAVTQNASYWEVPLATASITTGGVITVTDERSYVRVPGGGGTADGATLETVNGVMRIKDGGVSTTKLGNDSVDDTKVGARVPQFYRRQGGHATQWNAGGTTTYTPGAVRMQGGTSPQVTLNSGPVSGYYYANLTITFPQAFSDIPLVVVSDYAGGFSRLSITSIAANQFTLTAFHQLQGAQGSITWLAIGPE